MANYISKHSVMGMLSKNYIAVDDFLGYIKNKKEIVLFDTSLIEKYKNYEKISLNYMKEKNIIIPDYFLTSSYNSFMLTSFFDQIFFELKGKKFQEIRETRNKYNKKIIVKNNEDIEKVIDFIKKWDEKRGKIKYGWQLHSGYDKNFFSKYYLQEKKELWNFFFYLDKKLVGYSVVSREGSDCFNYILRKNFTEYRNLCLYIDFKTFEYIYGNIKKDFFINWGCSNGSLLKYKKKFPTYSCEKKYFLKYKQIT